MFGWYVEPHLNALGNDDTLFSNGFKGIFTSSDRSPNVSKCMRGFRFSEYMSMNPMGSKIRAERVVKK